MTDSNEDELDPRIEEELERLNSSSGDINKFEKEFESIQKAFVELSRQAGNELAAYQKRLHGSVDKARPYYQLKASLEKVQAELLLCTQEYEKYIIGFNAAEEMLRASEEKRQISPSNETCQVMVRVSQKKVATFAEHLASSKQKHSDKYLKVSAMNENLLSLKRTNSRHITRALPYFELYERMCVTLEKKKADLNRITASLSQAKHNYSGALSALEVISNEIHQVRKEAASAKESVASDSTAVGDDDDGDGGGGGDHSGTAASQRGVIEQQPPPSPWRRASTPVIGDVIAANDRPLPGAALRWGEVCAADDDGAATPTGLPTTSVPAAGAEAGIKLKRARVKRMANAIDPTTAGRLQSLDLPVEVHLNCDQRKGALMKTVSNEPTSGVGHPFALRLSRSLSLDNTLSLTCGSGVFLSTLTRHVTDVPEEEDAASSCSARSGSVSSIDEEASMLKGTLPLRTPPAARVPY